MANLIKLGLHNVGSVGTRPLTSKTLTARNQLRVMWGMVFIHENHTPYKKVKWMKFFFFFYFINIEKTQKNFKNIKKFQQKKYGFERFLP